MTKDNLEAKSTDIALIRDLYDKGLDADDMAMQCGMNRDTIIKLCQRVVRLQRAELVKSPMVEIFSAIDSLERLYRRTLYLASPEKDSESKATSPDIKLLQGIERCLELKMKLLGFDGKQQYVQPATAAPREEPTIAIDLAKLSRATIDELISLTDN